VKEQVFISCFLFLLALFSKESSVVLPFLFIIYDYLFRKRREKMFFKISSFLLLIFFYWIIRRHIFISWGIEFPCIFCNLGKRILVFFTTFLKFVELLLFPFGLHFERVVSLKENLFLLKSLIGFFLFMILFCRGISSRKKRPIYSLGIFWFLGMLIPTSQIYPLIVDDKFLASEHFLYFSQVGLFLFGLSFLKEKVKSPFLKFAILVPPLFLFSLLTVYYNQKQWQSEEEFFKYNLRYTETSRLYNNLGRLYQEKKDFKKAESCYRRAKELNSQYIKARYNLATLLAKEGKYTLAEKEYREILERHPIYSDVYNNLGVIRMRQNRLDEAIEFFREAISQGKSKSNSQIYCNLGLALEKKGEIKKAIVYYKKGIEVNPANIECLNLLGFSYVKVNNFVEALNCFERILKVDRNNVQALQNIGNIYFERKRYGKALTYYQRALKFDPNNKDIYNNLKITLQILNGTR